MENAKPKVFIISEPSLRWAEVASYLQSVGGISWYEGRRDNSSSDAEALVEFMGKLCYRSWAPGLNPNVKKVRDDQKNYIDNIMRSKHGSVLEHSYFSFIFSGVSRVFTHELVRHRAGVAISQESMRFVRLTDIPIWLPDWAKDDEELVDNATMMVAAMETFQEWMAGHFMLDQDDFPCPECEEVGAVTEGGVTNVCPRCAGNKRLPLSFHEKKLKTSFMRRFAPDGVATSIGWTANVRTIRHVIEQRTAEGAEEEIRLVFDKLATRLYYEYPLFFGDYERSLDGVWTTEWGKV